MDIEEFHALFGDGSIRAKLDWQALRAGDSAVQLAVSRSRSVLGSLFTVWYDGHHTYRDADAVPMRVGDAAAGNLGDRDSRIAAMENTFRAAGSPVQLTLPLYELGDGARLLLDGTHRSVAAFRVAMPVRLLLVSVAGPMDPLVLPDLRHHLANSRHQS